MKNIVVKYGGSSVATPEKINQVADRIIDKKDQYQGVVAVVSAMGDTTDSLIELAEKTVKSPSKREMDMLLSTGEQVTASLLAMKINEKGHKAIALTGFQAGFKTIGNHCSSKIDQVDTSRLKRELDLGYIVIVTGFQGINEKGDITTLGRGGSDTSAVALAAELDAPCHIYTDVKGIYTADPRIFKEAKKLDYLSYEETLEMAYLGAKVLEPRSVSLAKKYGVELYVGLNTGDVVGTYIVEEGEIMEKKAISNVSLTDDVLLVNMKLDTEDLNELTEIFTELADRDVNIDVISQNKKSKDYQFVSFTSDVKSKDEVREVLESCSEIKDFEFVKGVTKVSVVGSGMRNQPGVAADVFRVFSANKIMFYQVSTSEISISYIIDEEEKENVVRMLAEKFDL